MGPPLTRIAEFGYWCAVSKCAPASEFNRESEMLDSVADDTAKHYAKQDELEVEGQTRDELRAEHVKDNLETWREDATYLCQQLYKQRGADNECGEVLCAMQDLAKCQKFSPEWLRAACAFTDSLPKYAEQLAKEAYPE